MITYIAISTTELLSLIVMFPLSLLLRRREKRERKERERERERETMLTESTDCLMPALLSGSREHPGSRDCYIY